MDVTSLCRELKTTPQDFHLSSDKLTPPPTLLDAGVNKQTHISPLTSKILIQSAAIHRVQVANLLRDCEGQCKAVTRLATFSTRIAIYLILIRHDGTSL